MCGAIGRCCAGGDAISGEGDAMNLEYVLVVWFLYSAYSFVLHLPNLVCPSQFDRLIRQLLA
jgi:hypothetical protein